MKDDEGMPVKPANWRTALLALAGMVVGPFVMIWIALTGRGR